MRCGRGPSTWRRGEVEETLFDQDDDDKAINAFRIKFASGFEIMALSSAPRGLRGKQGVIIIDEAAFVDSLARAAESGAGLPDVGRAGRGLLDP